MKKLIFMQALIALLSSAAFGQNTYIIAGGPYRAFVGTNQFDAFGPVLNGKGFNEIGELHGFSGSDCVGGGGNGNGYMNLTIKGKSACYPIVSKSTSGTQNINGCIFPISGNFTFLKPDGSEHHGHVTFTGFRGRFCQSEIRGGYIKFGA